MDECKVCGQEICQAGYMQRLGEYTCANCRKKERVEKLLAMYGPFWPVWLTWNNLLNKLTVWQFLGTEAFADFANSLSNEVGEFDLKFSELARKLGVKIEYINRVGEIELCLWGFKNYEDATIVIVFDKFTCRLLKIITINGKNSNIKKLTNSMEVLLQSTLEFEEKVCHC